MNGKILMNFIKKNKGNMEQPYDKDELYKFLTQMKYTDLFYNNPKTDQDRIDERKKIRNL